VDAHPALTGLVDAGDPLGVTELSVARVLRDVDVEELRGGAYRRRQLVVRGVTRGRCPARDGESRRREQGCDLGDAHLAPPPPLPLSQVVAGTGSGRTSTVSATGTMSSTGRSARSACRRIASGLEAW